MKVGDLVVPVRAEALVHEHMQPMFSSRGRARHWEADQVALVVAVGVRHVGAHDVLKLQLLIEGELWWTGAGQAKPAGGYK